MKISTLMLLLSVFVLGAENVYPQQKEISLNLKNTTIKQAISRIEKASDYVFLVTDDAKPELNQKVDIKANKESISKILNWMLKDTNLTYSVVERQISLFKKATPSAQPIEKQEEVPEEQQQKRTINGRVSDNKGESLIGVNVTEVGTQNGTVTDVNGRYTLSTTADVPVLKFTYIGFKDKEVAVGNANIMNVTLMEDVSQLNEVVVIGYGSRNKGDITSAISNIDSEAIDKSITMSAEGAMQGTMSGVNVSGVSGDPMNRPTIRIRGTNTWGVASPLYVIDGVAINEMGAGVEGQDEGIQDLRGPINIMAMIDPNDIENISVLKDASAAAIYGVRAANGVILITTKKGRSGKPSIDFSTRFGIQNIKQNLNFMTTPEYVKFVKDIWATNPEKAIAVDNKGRFDSSDPLYLGNSRTYTEDWRNAVRNKNAASNDYSVKISGGTENVDYYISLGYAQSEGSLLANKLERYSGAIKINTKINDWIKTGINYRLVNVKGSDPTSTGPLNEAYLSMLTAPPWQPIYQAEGIPGYKGFALAVGGTQTDGTYDGSRLYGAGTHINWKGRAEANFRRYDSWRNLGSLYLELTPIKGLSIKGSLNIDKYAIERLQFQDYDANAYDYTSGDPKAQGGGKSFGAYQVRRTGNYNLTQELMVNYKKSFADHTFDLLFNFSNQKYNADILSASTQYLTTKKDYLMKVEGENQYTSTGSGRMRWALQGYLWRIGYNYASKYYLDATVRRDGSARFAPDYRWGIFPSVSGAWRISKEAFLQDAEWMDDFKLRAGWGQLGNQEVRDMAYLSIINKAPHAAFGNSSQSDKPAVGVFAPGATIFGIPNRELQWEKTETFNIGFDSQLFRGLSFSAEYYYKQTRGILQAIDIPPSVGVSMSPIQNFARVENSGIELSANWQGSVDALDYHIGGNLSTTANKVLETYNHIPSGTIEEGYSLFYHKAYKVAGVFQSDEEAQAWLDKYEDSNYTEKSMLGAGDFYFQDLRGAPKEEGEFYSDEPDGKIDAYDRVYIGKSIPGFFYGANLGASYKGLDFSANFTGVGDVLQYNSIKANTFIPSESDNVTDIVHKQWTPENKQNEYPRLVFGDPNANLRRSDFFYESGAYLRLQNLQIGYTLPRSFYKMCNNYIRNTRVYVGMSNVFTLTKYTGFDPENDAYPTPKTVFMGLNVKF